MDINNELSMNIVLYVNSFLPDIGGREMVINYLARSFVRLGHQVRVVGPAGYRYRRQDNYGFPIHRYPVIGSMKLWRKGEGFAFDESITKTPSRVKIQEVLEYWQLKYDLIRWGADVVHAHNTYPTGYAAIRYKHNHKLPLVITPHGEDIHKIPEISFGLRLNALLAKRILASLDHAELCTAISEGVEDSLLSAGAKPNKIRRIPNGVDTERFNGDLKLNIRQWLKISDDARMLVSVGNYHPRKGHEVIIRAMPAILQNEPRAHLVIVGRNPESLQPLVDELGIGQHVSLTGPIAVPVFTGSTDEANSDNDYLATLLRYSEMYISAGIDEGAEGLSLALLEGMAAQLPIVATNISGNRDIIFENENGKLVPPGDIDALSTAINSLLSDESNRKRIGNNAKEFAADFDWDVIAEKYIEVYKEAIELTK